MSPTFDTAKKRGMQPYSSERQAAAFWEKVDKTGPNGCWLYTGFRKWDGYGWLARSLNGKVRYLTAHRYAWMLLKGEVPGGLHVMHKCDNPPCCNPEHLQLGTHQQNMADQKAKLRHSFGERASRNKVTLEKANTIRSEYRRTGPKESNAAELSARHGVSAAIIHAIGMGRTWKINSPSPVLHPDRVRPERKA